MTIYNIFLENPPEFLNGKNYIKTLKDALGFLLSLDEIKKNYTLKDFNVKSLSFDIVFCNNEQIREINRDYRGKDRATDVITFAMFADSEPKFLIDGDAALGEIMISVEQAKAQAREGLEKELFTLAVHGILHLLGFDHLDDKSYNFVVGIQRKVLDNVEVSIEKFFKKRFIRPQRGSDCV